MVSRSHSLIEDSAPPESRLVTSDCNLDLAIAKHILSSFELVDGDAVYTSLVSQDSFPFEIIIVVLAIAAIESNPWCRLNCV